MPAPLLAIGGAIINGIFNVIDKSIEDKDTAAKIKADIASRQQELIETELKGSIQIILAEAQGGYWQRNWRPFLMLTVIAIIANNYVLAPYLGLIFGVDMILDLPEGLWTLLVTGVGGYIVGRSGEKIATTIKKPE